MDKAICVVFRQKQASSIHECYLLLENTIFGKKMSAASMLEPPILGAFLRTSIA